MEQHRGNHETKWKTPIIQEGTDGSLNDGNNDDDDPATLHPRGRVEQLSPAFTGAETVS